MFNFLDNFFSGLGTELYKDLRKWLKKRKKNKEQKKESSGTLSFFDILSTIFKTLFAAINSLLDTISYIIIGFIAIIFFLCFIESLIDPSSPISDSKSSSEPILGVIPETTSVAISEATPEITTELTSEAPLETTAELTSEAAPETILETAIGLTVPKEFQYVGSDKVNYPTSQQDFVSVQTPDGDYTFQYPKNFFKEAYYDEKNKSYTFITADKNIELNYYKNTQEKLLETIGEPLDSKYSIPELVDLFVTKKSEAFIEPYIFTPKEEANDNITRRILSGNLIEDPNQAYYICIAGKEKSEENEEANEEAIYLLIFKFPTDEKSESNKSPNGRTPNSYVSECLYRGWTLGGSTQTIRSYHAFQTSKN